MWRLDELLKHIVRYITLEPGDLVLTGTPAGVGPRMLQKYYAEFFLALLKLNTKVLSTKRYTYLQNILLIRNLLLTSFDLYQGNEYVIGRLGYGLERSYPHFPFLIPDMLERIKQVIYSLWLVIAPHDFLTNQGVIFINLNQYIELTHCLVCHIEGWQYQSQFRQFKFC